VEITFRAEYTVRDPEAPEGVAHTFTVQSQRVVTVVVAAPAPKDQVVGHKATNPFGTATLASTSANPCPLHSTRFGRTRLLLPRNRRGFRTPCVGGGALPVEVRLTNHSPSSVRVLGVRNTSVVASGDCSVGDPFTFRPRVQFVEGNTSAVVLGGPLFEDGTGYCEDPRRCGGKCSFEEHFEVVTPLGSVPAGFFDYRLSFSDCPRCGTAAAAAANCRPHAVRAP
jgi:hypothetical protein